MLNHRLPSHFDYHKIPAPWIQTKLLEILTLLGADDIETSQKMYESLGQMIRKSYDLGTNMGYALVYQCVTTITSIVPDKALIDLASTTIAKFLQSESRNLKYIGITGLARIVRIDPKCTLPY